MRFVHRLLSRRRPLPGPDIQASDVARGDLGPAPIFPAHVRTGAPVGRSLRLAESPDGRLVTDLWDCTAGSFDWYFDSDEIAHILDGEVHVRRRFGTGLLSAPR